MYKDFEKSNSYKSNFQGANFNYASLRAAKMKFCNFTDASFIGTEFIGTNLHGSTFRGAYFKEAIFWSTILKQVDFSGATFEDCYFVNTGTVNLKYPLSNLDGIVIMNVLPPSGNFSGELLQVVEDLRSNDIIRRSHTLHLKKGEINTLSLYILLQEFSEKELITALPRVAEKVSSPFFTLSYLKNLLKRTL